MRRNSILTSAGLVVSLTIGTISPAFAQAPVAQNRIAQQVMIGGLRVDASTVIAPGGGIQSYSCPGPQQYVTPQQEAPAPVQAPPPVVLQQVVQQSVYPPTVIYQYPVVQPAVVYRAPARVVYASPVYAAPVSSSAVVAAAAIGAAGWIATAVIGNSGHNYYHGPVYVVPNHGHRH